MSNFIIDCINGDALLSDVNDYIDKWHENDTGLPLHEFLGMRKKEYILFIEDENYLGSIIRAHKSDKNIESIIQDEIAIAARSDDTIKYGKLQKWLESEGL